MAKILIISPFYPPVQHIATNRIKSFAKYLKEFGHEITVITGGNKYCFYQKEDINIIRISESGIFSSFNTNKKENKFSHNLKSAYNLFLSFFIANEDYNWTKNVKKLINSKTIKVDEFDVVISSFPGIGSMEIAMLIKQLNTKILWVADMRDAIWSPSFLKKNTKKNILQFEYMKNDIDILLGVSKPQVENYEKLLISTKTRLLEVRNGYDFEVNKLGIEKTKNDFFTIVYSGSFYEKRKPKNFFIALNRILEKYDFKIKVRIIGNKAPINILQPLVRVVKEENTMPYEKLINELKFNADALLMISPKELEKGVYTGKIFDYLGCCKPIIGLVPKEDVAAKLINDVRLGYVAENESIEEIENIIVKAYKDWENDVQFTPNLEMIKKHHRREQVKRLNDVLIKRIKYNLIVEE